MLARGRCWETGSGFLLFYDLPKWQAGRKTCQNGSQLLIFYDVLPIVPCVLVTIQ